MEPQPDGTLAWRAGFYTPEEEYAAILQRGEFPEQAAQAQQEWIDSETRNGVAGDTVMIGGRAVDADGGRPDPG